MFDLFTNHVSPPGPLFGGGRPPSPAQSSQINYGVDSAAAQMQSYGGDQDGGSGTEVMEDEDEKSGNDFSGFYIKNDERRRPSMKAHRRPRPVEMTREKSTQRPRQESLFGNHFGIRNFATYDRPMPPGTKAVVLDFSSEELQDDYEEEDDYEDEIPTFHDMTEDMTEPSYDDRITTSEQSAPTPKPETTTPQQSERPFRPSIQHPPPPRKSQTPMSGRPQKPGRRKKPGRRRPRPAQGTSARPPKKTYKPGSPIRDPKLRPSKPQQEPPPEVRPPQPPPPPPPAQSSLPPPPPPSPRPKPSGHRDSYQQAPALASSSPQPPTQATSSYEPPRFPEGEGAYNIPPNDISRVTTSEAAPATATNPHQTYDVSTTTATDTWPLSPKPTSPPRPLQSSSPGKPQQTLSIHPSQSTDSTTPRYNRLPFMPSSEELVTENSLEYTVDPPEWVSHSPGNPFTRLPPMPDLATRVTPDPPHILKGSSLRGEPPVYTLAMSTSMEQGGDDKMKNFYSSPRDTKETPQGFTPGPFYIKDASSERPPFHSPRPSFNNQRPFYTTESSSERTTRTTGPIYHKESTSERFNANTPGPFYAKVASSSSSERPEFYTPGPFYIKETSSESFPLPEKLPPRRPPPNMAKSKYPPARPSKPSGDRRPPSRPRRPPPQGFTRGDRNRRPPRPTPSSQNPRNKRKSNKKKSPLYRHRRHHPRGHRSKNKIKPPPPPPNHSSRLPPRRRPKFRVLL